MTDHPPNPLDCNPTRAVWLVPLALIIIAVGLACQPAGPAVPTIPALTPPPPPTPPPAASQTLGSQTAQPTPTLQPVTARSPNPTAAPTPDASVSPAPTRSAVPTTPPAPTLSATASFDAADRLNGLIDQLLQPREVKADAVWSSFITIRTSSLIGFDETQAVEIRVKMLEMWHTGNDCYAALEDEIGSLEQGRHLTLIEYPQFLEYAYAKLSPCLDLQISLIEPGQFFANPPEVRAERIARWFDSAWQDDSGQLGDLAPTCRESFYAYLPDVVEATDPAGFDVVWNTALSGQVQCLMAATQHDLGYLMDPQALFDLPPNQWPEMIALYTTITGHILAIGMGRDYDPCWSDFEARIPAVAASRTMGEMSLAHDSAMESLAECVHQLPLTNRFNGQ